MPKLKKRLKAAMAGKAMGRMRGPGGGADEVTTGEYQAPVKGIGGVRGMVAQRRGEQMAAAPGGRAIRKGRQARVGGTGQPQPPLTTSGAAIPEVAAADTQRAVEPAQPAIAPIPGAGEMGPVPRGVQDAGAGAGGPVTAGGPVAGPAMPAEPINLRGRFMGRFGQGGPGAAIEPAARGPAGPAAPMMAQYMANRGRMNVPPAQRGPLRKRKSRFFTGAR